MSISRVGANPNKPSVYGVARGDAASSEAEASREKGREAQTSSIEIRNGPRTTSNCCLPRTACSAPRHHVVALAVDGLSDRWTSGSWRGVLRGARYRFRVLNAVADRPMVRPRRRASSWSSIRTTPSRWRPPEPHRRRRRTGGSAARRSGSDAGQRLRLQRGDGVAYLALGHVGRERFRAQVPRQPTGSRRPWCSIASSNAAKATESTASSAWPVRRPGQMSCWLV